MPHEPSCIFCRIVEGRAPAHLVWSDAELRLAADRLRAELADAAD